MVVFMIVFRVVFRVEIRVVFMVVFRVILVVVFIFVFMVVFRGLRFQPHPINPSLLKSYKSIKKMTTKFNGNTSTPTPIFPSYVGDYFSTAQSSVSAGKYISIIFYRLIMLESLMVN